MRLYILQTATSLSAIRLRLIPPRSCGIWRDNMSHMTGDTIHGHTNQGIQLLGMPTEAIHTPLLQDRFLSIRSALYVFNAARDLGEQFDWREDSLVAHWAGQILREAVDLLRQIDDLGLFKALEAGLFADIKRSPEGGRGLEGVMRRNEVYFNPFYEKLLSLRQVGLSETATV